MPPSYYPPKLNNLLNKSHFPATQVFSFRPNFETNTMVIIWMPSSFYVRYKAIYWFLNLLPTKAPDKISFSVKLVQTTCIERIIKLFLFTVLWVNIRKIFGTMRVLIFLLGLFCVSCSGEGENLAQKLKQVICCLYIRWSNLLCNIPIFLYFLSLGNSSHRNSSVH